MTARTAPVDAGRAHASARRLNLQLVAVSRYEPMQLQIELGAAENLAGNRFGGSELCHACGQPHSDSNYVATDAEGESFSSASTR